MFHFPSRLTRLAACLALGLAVIALRPAPTRAQQADDAGERASVGISDLGREVALREPAISPSGRSVVMVTERADYEQNRYVRSLVRVDLATGDTTDLTPERTFVARPTWSPSGDRIAFLADDEEGASQLFVLASDGGEARRVTDGEQGIRFYAWAGDGQSLVFGRERQPQTAAGEERHNRSFVVEGDPYLIEAPPRSTHLWRVPSTGGESTRLTGGTESVESVASSPDGRTLALLVQPSAHATDEYRRRVERLDLVTGNRRTVARGRAATVSFSPDGDRLAVSLPGSEVPYLAPHGVFVSHGDDGELRRVTGGVDRDLTSLAWLPDGGALLVSGPDRSKIGVWLQPLDGSARRLDTGDVEASSALSVSGDGRVAFIGRTPDRSRELYVMDGPDGSPRRITRFNRWIEDRALGRVETVSWESADGFEVDGVLTYPPDFEAGERYPVLVAPHGGPDLTDTEAFDLVAQLFAARGWLVFQPNYRGSNSQGAAFQGALLPEVLSGPARDVLDGLEAVKARGIIDTTRMAISGWSYGGMLTAWLISHHDGWAAAVVGQASVDWVDDYALSTFTYADSVWFGGSPYVGDNAKRYRQQSPIAHAHRIRTPTLILSTTRDVLVPITSSFELYHALEDNGVEVKLVAYPGGGHWPSDPVQFRDLWRRWIGWVDRHFGGGVDRRSTETPASVTPR